MSTESPNQFPEFYKDLLAEFPDDVHSDAMSRGLYSTDASIYQQTPSGFFTPRNAESCRKAMVLANQHSVPVLARGGGTSLAGQTTAKDALVIDVSKNMYALEELNAEKKYVMVQPGLVRDQLNAQIAKSALMFAPETSTSNRANIGGMMMNNSSGMMSIRYGTTIHHIDGADGILADGRTLYFGRRSEMDATGHKLLDDLLKIINPKRALIEERFPKVIRRVGGYSLDSFLDDDPNLVKILCGSEGTLAFVTRIKATLVTKPKVVCAVAVHFADLLESLHATPMIVKHKPLSVEFMDGPLIQMSLANASVAPLCFWLEGSPEAVLGIEMDGDSIAECEARIDAVVAELKAAGYGYAFVKLLKDAERQAIVEVRKAGLGVMLKMNGDTKPISFIEDACVPVEHLADYTKDVYAICKDEDVPIMTYGHASVGVLHLKPVVNLKTQQDRDKCERISRRAMEACRKYKGSWSGEHGDGIARGAQNELFWGDEMMEVFRDVKRLFDPKGILNPGKIFDTPPVMGPLRYTGDYHKTTYESKFHYRSDGGFESAVEMCSGVGQCRKFGSGTMCPSYMATRDEKDSTRGRANGLRLAMSGQLGPDGMTSQELYDVMDLCLECKACSTECPSNVDMAKMKSEFLYTYQKKHGRSIRSRLFAGSPKMSRRNAGFLAPFANFTLSIPFLRRTINRVVGVAVERELPLYAPVPFQKWFRNRKAAALPPDAKEVVLFNDTYVNYHETHVGQWAVRVLEGLGYKVTLANAGCCCRPQISKGFLDEAKEIGGETLRNLDAFARKGFAILTIEPSCASSLRDDLPDLIDDEAMGKRIRESVMPIEEFLDREQKAGHLKIDLSRAKPSYLLHGHCHQKALNGTGPLKALMGSADGKARISEVDSGCCGMAGSFGYEQEHYKVSQAIGEQRLFPTVRKLDAETPVIANGFSCRHQIKDATGRKPMHFIEALGRAMYSE
ncbi:FAD-binding and (Fe-S)-binding domain-containing protein [soil metagenome]